MTEPVSFFVPGICVPKGSMKAFRHRASGRVVVTHDDVRTSSWCKAIATAARAARVPSFGSAPIMIYIDFFVERPQRHFGRRGLLPSAPAHPATRPDIDKLVRAVLDGLTGVAWIDDGQVSRLSASKSYADAADGHPTPGVSVRIVELHDGGQP